MAPLNPAPLFRTILKQEIDSGIADWVRFIGEWKKESTQAFVEKRIPSFYDRPQLWLRHAGINPNEYSKDHQREIMYKLIEVFKSGEFFKFQEKKAWFDCQALIQRELKPLLDKIKEERMAVESKTQPLDKQKAHLNDLREEIKAMKGPEAKAKKGGTIVGFSAKERRERIVLAKEFEAKQKEDVKVLAQMMKKAIEAQASIVRSKENEYSINNPFRNRFINHFHSSYLKEIKKTEEMLQSANTKLREFIRNFEDFKNPEDAAVKFEELRRVILHDLHKSGINEKKLGVNIKHILQETADRLFESVAKKPDIRLEGSQKDDVKILAQRLKTAFIKQKSEMAKKKTKDLDFKESDQMLSNADAKLGEFIRNFEKYKDHDEASFEFEKLRREILEDFHKIPANEKELGANIKVLLQKASDELYSLPAQKPGLK